MAMRWGFALIALMASNAARADCSLSHLVDLPITLYGSRPQIEAKINGRPTRFVLDSGAFWSVISPGTAAENALRREPAPQGMLMSGVGGTTSLEVVRVSSLMLANVSLSNIEFFVGGSEVGGQAGVIGQNVLHFADVEYDLPHGRIGMYQAKNCASKALAYWASDGQPLSVLPLEDNGARYSHTRATILINGHKVHAMFDTGAQTSVLSLAAAARMGIKPDTPGVVSAGYGSGFGSRMVATWIAPISEIQIGGETLHNNKIAISDLGEIDMLIGMDFFLAHRVYVANSQNKIYFTYTGGNFFSMGGRSRRAVDGEGKTLAVTDTTADPTSAEGYSLRGMAAAAQNKIEPALADLDKAVELAPNEARYRYQRAMVSGRSGKRDVALADLDKALSIDPNYSEALIARSALRLARHDRDGAKADIVRVSHVENKASNMRFTIAEMFDALDDPASAIGEWTQWIDAHPVDSRRPMALNGRCWARALANVDLGKALSDCNAAIRANLHRDQMLDSRGLVHLRMGDFAGAIADYDAALAINPKMAWSLYGRGIAHLRMGDKAKGMADIEAATKLSSTLPGHAKRFGIEL